MIALVMSEEDRAVAAVAEALAWQCRSWVPAEATHV